MVSPRLKHVRTKLGSFPWKYWKSIWKHQLVNASGLSPRRGDDLTCNIIHPESSLTLKIEPFSFQDVPKTGSPQKVEKSKGTLPKMAETFRLRIYNKLPKYCRGSFKGDYQVIQAVTFLFPILEGHNLLKGHVFTVPKSSQRIARNAVVQLSKKLHEKLTVCSWK